MNALIFVDESGRRIEFSPHDSSRFNVQPLNSVELIRAAESKNPSLPVVVTNASAPAESTGLERDGPLNITARLSGNGPVIAYGLVDGGWLPLPWAHKRIAWLDRNVVIALERLQSSGMQAANRDPGWLAKRLGLDTETVSPMLCAIEGATRRPPTEFEMRAELNRATRVLRNVLPGAKVEKINPPQRKALHKFVLDYSVFRARATSVLTRAVPLIVDRAKPERRKHVEEQVLDIVTSEGLPRVSLPVLALLSCIYDSNPAISTHRAATPGRAVLKPTQNYTAQDAYNALSDLFFLELLFNVHTLFPDIEPVLYTRDVGIAAFWTALQPCEKRAVHTRGGRLATSVTFSVSGLFPSLSEEESFALKARLLSV